MSNKTPTTLKMESMLKLKYGNILGKFIVFEVQFGFHQSGENIQYCDAATYDTKGELTCFELKATVSDFHSKAKLTFYGHKNYYVMPLELYEKVKGEIPPEIGVQVLCNVKYVREDTKTFKTKRVIEHGDNDLFTIKRCISQKNAKVDERTILWSFVRSMSNSSNRAVEENCAVIDETIKKHLEIVDLDGDIEKVVDVKNAYCIENPAIQLFVTRRDFPKDYWVIYKKMRGN